MAIAVASFIGVGVTHDTDNADSSEILVKEEVPAIKGIDKSLIPALLVMLNEDFDEWLKGEESAFGKLHEKTILTDGAFSASAITKNYEDNEVAADNKFKGKKIRITGIVESINKDIGGGVFLALKGNKIFGGLSASMAKESASETAELRKGQKIELFCTGRGMILTSVMVGNCMTVSHVIRTVRTEEAMWVERALEGKAKPEMENERKFLGYIYSILEASPVLKDCLETKPIESCNDYFDKTAEEKDKEIKQRYSELVSLYKWPVF